MISGYSPLPPTVYRRCLVTKLYDTQLASQVYNICAHENSSTAPLNMQLPSQFAALIVFIDSPRSNCVCKGDQSGRNQIYSFVSH